ncbi:MAG: alpha/beta hydrolase [Hyphomonas sp.]
MKLAAILLAAIATVLALVFGGAYAMQDKVLFHPDSTRVVPKAGYIEVEDIQTKDGEDLVGWYVPPSDGCPIILFLHGNGSRLDRDVWRYERIHDQGVGLLALAWRGYSGSTGKPSERGFNEDADAAWSWLMAKGYAPHDVILQGFSIGSGPATRLASLQDAGALILEAPYYSMADLIRQKTAGVPVDLVLKHSFHSDRWIKQVDEPVLMAHGGVDGVIPASQSKRLFELANTPKTYRLFDASDHNTLVRDGLYEEAIWPFLSAHWTAPTQPDSSKPTNCYLSQNTVSGETL